VHWRVAHDFNSTLPGWLILVPRMSDLPVDRRGPGVLQYRNPRSTEDRLTDEQRDGLALTIRAALADVTAGGSPTRTHR
jgi:hypothetical protein